MEILFARLTRGRDAWASTLNVFKAYWALHRLQDDLNFKRREHDEYYRGCCCCCVGASLSLGRDEPYCTAAFCGLRLEYATEFRDYVSSRAIHEGS